MDKQVSFVATISFYEASMEGCFDNEPSIYELRGGSLEEVKDGVEEIFWQATEIEMFDGAEVLVEVQIERNGEYIDRDELHMRPMVVRTAEPSGYIIWGSKKPHLFKIDRAASDLRISCA